VNRSSNFRPSGSRCSYNLLCRYNLKVTRVLITSRLYLHNLREGSSPPSFLLLKAQIVPVVRGAQLYDFLDGSIKELSSTVTVIRDGKSEQEANLAHAAWIVQDQ
jgi:hypothetical protein